MPRPPFTPKKPFGKPFGKPSAKPFRKPDLQHSPKPVINPDHDLIYGLHAVAAAVQNPKRKSIKLWASENGMARLREEGAGADLTSEIVHPRHLDHLLLGEDAVHQGLVLEAEPLRQPRLDQVARDGLIVLLDQVTDPHNVGAILRSCVAFGVTALVSTARHTAAANGTMFKAASGGYEHVPMVTVTNLARAMEELKDYGFQIVGLDSEAEADLETVSGTRPLALVLGAEGKGLRQLTRSSCHALAKITMPGAIKSLNVSIAAALSLYAVTRSKQALKGENRIL
jgi:23S rRNA (guanosine2251-2'-O)-methyltransferase